MSTRRPDSFLWRRALEAVALSTLLLSAQAVTNAAPRQQKGRQAPPAAEEPAVEAKVPIRVKRVETPGGPGVVATIGEFPEDLNEAGQEFLRREFFEHFASDVLGLGETQGATLKMAMLPQEKKNQRECDFTVGKVSGHIVVLVEKRRVLIACIFSEEGQKPQLLAGTGARVGAGG